MVCIFYFLGTHYFQSQSEEADSKRALVGQQKDRVASNNTTVLLLTPRTARRRREDAKRKPKQPTEILHRESSTEEDIIEKIGKNNNLIVEHTISKACREFSFSVIFICFYKY